MTLSQELSQRGFVNQTTFEDITDLDEKQFTLYLGTDPSGDSLHVGHLAVYMMVRRFIDRGHTVFLLVGGGTGMVGDPRDTEERELKSPTEIEHNKQALAKQVSQLFAGQDFTLIDNYDWLKDVKLLDFLRDIGKTFSMGQLIDREFFKARVGGDGAGMSYAEFSYTLLQGYDYLYLHDNYNVNLQIGGSDQWGNILSGVDLVRKKRGANVHGMTAPLVVDKTTGRKFGKSEAGNAIWLDEHKTSVFDFYQFWLNVDDDSAIDYLKLFTLLPINEIEILASRHVADPAKREAQRILAAEVTTIVHGADRARGVEIASDVLFGGRDLAELTNHEADMLAREIPVAHTGQSVVEALTNSGLAASNGEARRLIVAGAISVNGEKVTIDQKITKTVLLKKGKNSFVLVK